MDIYKNQLAQVHITDMSEDGAGIGHTRDGYTLFVKDAVIGDVVNARIVRPRKYYGFARTEEILLPSPDRVRPRCPVASQCGGCQLQALSYGRQLDFKQGKIYNALLRIGGFPEETLNRALHPIISMERPYRYRNKALYPVGTDRAGNLVAGFYAGRTHQIISNTDCALGAEGNRKILELILHFCQTNRISAYDERTGRGTLRHILIRQGFATGQVMVCLVINGERMLGEARLAKRLFMKIPGMTSFYINTNTEATNVALGKNSRLVQGEETIEDTIGGFRFGISPRSFYQVNPVQTERVYAQALAYAGLTGRETVWDLYCGIGTISLFLAKHARQVHGVEIVGETVDDARRNALLNGVDNVSFTVGRAEEVLPAALASGGEKADVIVVDPPRKGCGGDCLTAIAQMAPSRIVYVSCDPATLARDLNFLSQNGYRLEQVQPFDNFPQAVHVETVVLMSRTGR